MVGVFGVTASFGACDASDISEDTVDWEQCLELEDPEAECPSVGEAARELDLDADSEFSEKWPERRYTGDDGKLYIEPAECCYTTLGEYDDAASYGSCL